MLPGIAVSPPPDAPRVLVAALEDACTGALRAGGGCHADDGGGGALGQAIVTWLDGERLHALVHVTAARRTRERRLGFVASDPERERWRAIGFAIATLADDAKEESDADPSPQAPPIRIPVPVAPPTAPPVAPTASPRGRTLFAGLEAQAFGGVGGALDGGVEGKVGATVVGDWEGIASFGTGLLGGGSVDTIASRLSWVSVGVRAPLWRAPFLAVLGRADIGAELLDVSVSRAGRNDGATRWTPLFRVALDAELPVSAALALSASAELGVRTASTTLLVQGDEVGSLPLFRAAVGLGIVARF